MVEYDIGRLPIVEDGRIYGIVSRTDILRTLHGDQYPRITQYYTQLLLWNRKTVLN